MGQGHWQNGSTREKERSEDWGSGAAIVMLEDWGRSTQRGIRLPEHSFD